MANVNLAKRLFTLAVVAMTILWTGAAGLVPLVTNAQVSLSEGDLIKGSSFSTVYYYDGEGRWTFPNEKVYFSWYSNFSGVRTVSDSQLAGIALSGNVMQRAGTQWIKITSDPKVYAVSPDGVLHWIESESVASALYGGSGWNTFVQDMPDVFFQDYSTGASLMSAGNLYNGALVEYNGDTFLIWDGHSREVSSAGMSANGLQSKHVLNTTVDVSAIAAGSALTSESAEISDVSQEAVGDEPAVAGDLTVSVASSTPAGATLPDGATGVETTTWKFTGTGTVSSLVLNLGGVNATTIINNIYLYEGSARLTDGRSINSATRQATFSNINFVVSGTRYLTAVTEFAVGAAGGETVSLGIASAAGITSTADVGGSFPLNGNTFTMAANNAGTVTVTKSGSINNPAIGAQDAVISQFRLATATEGGNMKSITLLVENAVDHDDFKLWDGTVLVANGVLTTGDYVNFVLGTPFFVDEGNSNIFKVTADMGGQNGEDVQVYLDNDSDLIMTGADYGYGMIVDRGEATGDAGTFGGPGGASCNASTDECSYSTLEGGDVTFTFNGPSANDVGVGEKDVVFMEFALSVTQDITIKNFPIRLGADEDANGDALDGVTAGAISDADGLYHGTATAEGNLQDISIRRADTQQRLWGPNELAADSTIALDAIQTITFTEDVFFAGGTSLDLEITADVNDDTTAAEIFAVLVDMDSSSGTLTVEDNNGDSLTVGTEIVPSGDINGNGFTARAPSMAVALSSAPTGTGNTTVQGSSNVHMISFTLTAGTAEDANITDFMVSAYGDNTAVGAINYTKGGEANAQVEDFISSCSLYDGSNNLVGGPKGSASTGNTFTFDNISWVVEAGTVDTAKVICNLSNPSDTTDRYFALDMEDVSADMTTEDEDGDDIVETGDDPNGIDADHNDTVEAAPSVAWTVASAGTIAVALDSSSPSAMLLMSGTSDNWVASFRATATNEDFEIQTFAVYERQATDDSQTSASAYANNVGSVTISYEDADGVTQTDTAFMSANTATFSGLEAFVDVDQPSVIDLYVDVPSIDRSAGGSATSGERLELTAYETGSTGASFKSVGIGSGTTVDEDGVTLNFASRLHEIVETYPTVSLHASSPSGDASPGNNEALRFTVAAAGNEDVVLSEIVFEISATNNAGSATWTDCDTTPAADSSNIDEDDFNFYNLDSTTALDTTASSADWVMYDIDSGTGLLEACGGADADPLRFVKLTLPTAEVIAAGSTETYKLMVDTTGASSSSNDTFRVDIPTDPIVDRSEFTVLAANTFTAYTTATTDIPTASDLTATLEQGLVVCANDDDGGCDSTDELFLVSGEDANSIFASRGYMGGNAQITVDTNDAGYYAQSSFVWFDDGSTTDTTDAYEDEVKGSYLVDNLPITGGTFVF